MKILHLIDSGGMYGAEVALLNLAVQQSAMGYSVAILSARQFHESDKAIDSACRRMGLSVESWPMKNGLQLIEGYKIRRWAVENGFNVLHSHGYKFNILINSLPFPHRFLFVSTIHGYTASKKTSKLFVYKFIDQIFLRRAGLITVVSNAIKKQASVFSNALYIPNGIPLKYAEPNVNGKKATYILFLGRLSEEKNPEKIIDIFNTELAKSSNIKLFMAGDGPLRRKLEQKVDELKLNETVNFLGYVDEPSSLLQGAAALVLTSHSEGFPMVVLEAMRCKTPIFSTKVGEIPSIFGDQERGFLFSDTTSAGMAEILFETLKNTKIIGEAVDAAFEYFCENYTVEAMAEKYINAYRSRLEKYY